MFESFESIFHIVFKLADALQYVIECTMTALFFKEQFRLHDIHNCFYTGHVQNTIMQEFVKSRHVMH